MTESKTGKIAIPKRGVAINKTKTAKLQIVKKRLGINQDTEAVHRVLRWYLMLIGDLPGKEAVPIGDKRLFPTPPIITGYTYPKEEDVKRISIKIGMRMAKYLAPKLASSEGISGCFGLAELVNQALDTMFPLLGITEVFQESDFEHSSATAAT